MKKPMSPFTRVAIAFAFAVSALGLLAVGTHTNEVTTDEKPDWVQRNETYGINLGQYVYTGCLNGWLVSGTTAHNRLYVRDEEFKPIRCKGK